MTLCRQLVGWLFFSRPFDRCAFVGHDESCWSAIELGRVLWMEYVESGFTGKKGIEKKKVGLVLYYFEGRECT